MTKAETIADWKEKLETNPAWALRALVVVYNEQTPTEQDYEVTAYTNGVGFTGIDAEILTSFAKQYLNKVERFGRTATLSPRQMELLHKKMPKYAGQLYRLTQGKTAVAA
jgi:hypothetical protein